MYLQKFTMRTSEDILFTISVLESRPFPTPDPVIFCKKDMASLPETGHVHSAVTLEKLFNSKIHLPLCKMRIIILHTKITIIWNKLVNAYKSHIYYGAQNIV